MIDLRQGDCLDILPNIDDNSIDCIITSPPYNFDMDYNTYEDNKKWNDYFDWLDKVWKECYRVLKDDGRLIINVQPLFSDYIPSHSIITSRVLDIGFKWKAEILWEKNNYNCGYCTWGSWKSPSMPYMKYTWEFVEVFVKKQYKKVGDNKNIDITADEFKKWVVAKWNIAPEKNMKEYGHPAMFPEELPERLLKLFTYQHDIILDPFMGCGTVGVVCERTNRSFIGIEIDEKYFKAAKERIDRVHNESHQMNMFEDKDKEIQYD